MKYVYSFNEGNKDMRDILGGKGANLAEMTSLGFPVPSGFTVSTDACKAYYDNGEGLSDNIVNEIMDKLKELEVKTGKVFGDVNNPLLVSVRSGAPASMPGMMDTILNLGLNDSVAVGFSKITNNKRFVFDSYRRLIQMFADVVMGYPKQKFERVLDKIKEEKNVKFDTDLTEQDMIEVTVRFKLIYKEISGNEFPQDPRVQLMEAVKAVFRSWNNDRAKIYRKMNNILDSLGTAVNVQEMVYGNSGDNSGTGVAFTRNPSTGENKLYGEYLMNAQGEDVVAGIRTPKDISTLKDVMPDVYQQFHDIAKKLENHYRDMQDMEFTIENGKLFMLQTRNGKRTAQAALRVAVDLVNEGLITRDEALMRVSPDSLDQLLHPVFDEDALKNASVIAKGLAASPGAASGKIYFNASDVSLARANGENTILVRLETSPEDIQGMNDANGILTVRGGMTSHAAVVARGMGKCCVSGCDSLVVSESDKTLKIADAIFKEGDYISLDGSTGCVYGEMIKTVEPTISGDFETFMKWADDVRVLGVRANADTVRDAKVAYNFGAEGIGLCRTEHMFFESDKIEAVRQMIIADNEDDRYKALKKILPMQRTDFEGLFREMKGRCVTIRYLDPPLHEFLPKTREEIKELASSLNISYEALKQRIDSLKEFNPMMGHRGCRLAITYPSIAKMQTRAVIEACINIIKEDIKVKPQIMIPLITDINEFNYVKKIVDDTAKEVMDENNMVVDYEVGTMMETPRGALTADVIAESADFFSFGTNDLTQLTYGFSRDDSSKFLADYYDKKVFESDPFKTIDQDGVGKLMKIGVKLGKTANKQLHVGICGEHAGESASIEFCHNIGVDYVSCSPYRVPVARLAAAQVAIKNNKID